MLAEKIIGRFVIGGLVVIVIATIAAVIASRKGYITDADYRY